MLTICFNLMDIWKWDPSYVIKYVYLNIVMKDGFSDTILLLRLYVNLFIVCM